MKTILFVGNFLFKTTGTSSVSYRVGKVLRSSGHATSFASRYHNRYIRFLHILSCVAFGAYDIVHIDVFSNNSFLFARVSSYLARLRRKRIVLNLRGGALADYYKGREEKFAALFGAASRIITPSTFLERFFSDEGFRIKYLPNSINIEDFPFNRTGYQQYSLLWVRAFATIYNPHLAILALKEIQKTYPSATLTMVGPDKGLLTEMRRFITACGLDGSIEIVGPISNKDLFRYYHSHHVYLNTPSYESFGVALLEAASCGMPIVSTSVGEIPHLWRNGEEVLLVNKMDGCALSMKICEIFSDPNLETRLSTNARLQAENFGWDKIRGKWFTMLSDL